MVRVPIQRHSRNLKGKGQMSAQTKGFVIGLTVGIVATYWYVGSIQNKGKVPPRTQA